MKIFRLLLPLACLFMCAFAPLSAAEAGAAEPVRAELIAKERSIKPGTPFWVAIKLEMAEGWDTYWHNPGDSGFATEVKWDLPKGFTAGPLHWPYPERFDNDSLVAFGYTETALLLAEITPPNNLTEGDAVTLQAEVNWLACREACVPGTAQLALALPILNSVPEIDSAHSATFAKAERLLPKPGDVAVKTEKGQIALTFTPLFDEFGEIENLTFIPDEGEVIDYHAEQKVLRESDGSVTLQVESLNPGKNTPIKGVLLVSEKGSQVKKAIQIDSEAATKGVTLFSSIWLALGAAFLGGMILNVMPCVLPVIALKIFSFVKMAEQKTMHVIKHGLFFSMGVVLSFWLLSGLLLVLRASGESIGWGFQLQEPVFVAIMISILFLLGLSLFGLFEMGTSLISLGSKSQSGKSPLSASFMSGILATLVATPCTGPLLGPAIGFAMTLPAAKSLLIFTFVGLGMAFPYLFFSFFPKLVRFLPKPGNWMITFKQLMGFIMMATVLWLLWVFSAQTDFIALFALLAALMVMAIAAWIYGKWATPVRKKITRRIATLLAIVMVAFSGTYALGVAKHSSHLPTQIEEGRIVYSPERVKQLREEGKTVFVDFTAKWCLICQVNKAVLHSAEIKKYFEEHNVVFIEADWTKKDPIITEELQKLGRSGVPVYALYPSDVKERPMILPQNLTAKMVIDHVAKVDASTTIVNND